METGNVVKSLKGHDTGRIYVVTAIINDDFVLIADGKYRMLSDPKMKRKKHLAVIGNVGADTEVTDAALRKICKR